jgi:enolase
VPVIHQLEAMEILDSRGRPTLSATCLLEGGAAASAAVPSGASTGQAEMRSLRDGEPLRYGGLGCRKAAAHVCNEINANLSGRTFDDQAQLDAALLQLDGTADKSRLGSNAILSVSIAFARACAAERGVTLYRHFADMASLPLAHLPCLTINLFSGGKHAGGQVPIQDVLVVPISAKSIDDGLAMVYAIYQSAAALTLQKYGMRALTADEGGLAPPFPSVDAMLSDAVAAIQGAGLTPGKDAALAVDVASSHFFNDGHYQLGHEDLDSSGMIERISTWVARYPIISVEDGLSENDWQHWPALRQRIGDKALVLGDDLLCTNPARIGRAIETRAASALLLKVDQVGTLTEATESLSLARQAGWSVSISARSGETEDNWLADLAVGWSANHIKVGSITQSERLAKYNRLLAIERETNLPIAPCRRL